MSEQDYYLKVLRDKIQILSRGILLPKNQEKYGANYQAERGGPGPQGRKYTIYYPDRPPKDIFLPVYSSKYYYSKYSLKTEEVDDEKIRIPELDIVLKRTHSPIFRKQMLSDGSPVAANTVSGIHSYHTYVTTLSLSCSHFNNHEESK